LSHPPIFIPFLSVWGVPDPCLSAHAYSAFFPFFLELSGGVGVTTASLWCVAFVLVAPFGIPIGLLCQLRLEFVVGPFLQTPPFSHGPLIFSAAFRAPPLFPRCIVSVVKSVRLLFFRDLFDAFPFPPLETLIFLFAFCLFLTPVFYSS